MRKIISVFIACAMFILPTTMVFADEIKTELAQSSIEFLKMLDIAESDVDLEKEITRAHFSDLLVKAINESPSANPQDVFTDVTLGTAYAGSVCKAYELGFISGSVDGYFLPDEGITAEAAIKMSVIALGYKELAEAYGGYPIGYIRVANEIGLTKGVNTSENFAPRDVFRLLYNFLTADICKITAVNANGAISYERDLGNNPLRVYFHLEKNEGVIKTAGYESMILNYVAKEYCIYVNGVKYTTQIENAEKYLGLSAQVWYDENNDVRAIFVNRNTSVNKNAGDIESFLENSVAIFDKNSNVSEKLTLSPSYTFVKNGRCITPSPSDFLKENSEYTFLDNDYDGMYDVVFGYMPEYIVVSSVNRIDGIVYDKNFPGKFLLLDENMGINYTLRQTDNKNLQITFEELSENDVIKYYISDDKTYVVGEVSQKSISGEITEVYDDTVVINGKEYKINKYFGSADLLKFGVNYTLLLASDGTITSVTKDLSGKMKYGFLVRYASLKRGFDYLTEIKILCDDNRLLETELADKITLDGKKNVSKDSPEVNAKLKNKSDTNITEYQVIRYALDEDKKVAKIDTATEISESEYSPEILIENKLEDDILTRHFFKKKVFYYGSYGVLAPNALIGDETIFVSVPVDFTQGATKEYDEEDFSIITSSDLSSYETVEVTMYDINKNLEPAVVLFYKGVSYDEDDSVSKKATPAIVRAVTTGMTDEGEITTIISYYQGNRFWKMPIEPEKNSKVQASDLPAPGDIIRFVENKDGEIANFVIDLRFSDASNGNPPTLSTTTQTLKSSLGNHRIAFGRVYYHTNSNMLLKIMGGKASGHDYAADIAGYKIASDCSVVLYESSGKIAKPGNLEMISDEISVGAGNGTLIAIKTYGEVINNIFIYK